MVSDISANMAAWRQCWSVTIGLVMVKFWRSSGCLKRGRVQHRRSTVQCNLSCIEQVTKVGHHELGEASSWTAPALVLMVEVRGSADRKESCCIVTIATWEKAYTVLTCFGHAEIKISKISK